MAEIVSFQRNPGADVNDAANRGTAGDSVSADDGHAPQRRFDHKWLVQNFLLGSNCVALLFTIIALSTRNWVTADSPTVESYRLYSATGLFFSDGFIMHGNVRYGFSDRNTCSESLYEIFSGFPHVQAKLNTPAGQILQMDHRTDCQKLNGAAATQILSMVCFLGACVIAIVLLNSKQSLSSKCRCVVYLRGGGILTVMGSLFSMITFSLIVTVRDVQQRYWDFLLPGLHANAGLGFSFALAVTTWLIGMAVSLGYFLLAWSLVESETVLSAVKSNNTGTADPKTTAVPNPLQEGKALP